LWKREADDPSDSETKTPAENEGHNLLDCLICGILKIIKMLFGYSPFLSHQYVPFNNTIFQPEHNENQYADA